MAHTWVIVISEGRTIQEEFCTLIMAAMNLEVYQSSDAARRSDQGTRHRFHRLTILFPYLNYIPSCNRN